MSNKGISGIPILVYHCVAEPLSKKTEKSFPSSFVPTYSVVPVPKPIIRLTIGTGSC